MSTVTARQAGLSWFVNPDLMKRALLDSFLRLTPRYQWRNPVMFVVYIGSILTTILWLQAILGKGEAPAGFILAVTLWLWVTLLFANFAEAIAEGRSKAQAASLKSARRDTIAKKLAKPQRDAAQTPVPSNSLRKGDVVLVVQGDLVPGDGEVIEGAASIDESAITGESAPVIRAAGSDFNTVTGGTRVLSDWVIVRINVNPGEAFLDRMIGMVEGAKRQKTPNEIALTILLVAMTLVFLLATVTLAAVFALQRRGREGRHAGNDHRAGCAAGMPDPDDDRRLAVGDRRRRHGPHDARQCRRDIRPRGRGRRRLRRIAAGQDRHDNVRQPPGIGTFPDRRA